MNFLHYRACLSLIIICFLGGCANIVPPQGGDKDTKPPVLLSVSPQDSLLNTRVNKIELRFDEYIVVTDAASEVHISPLLPFPLDVEGNSRKVTVRIPDTLLQDNTTYRITFGKAIKDLHENNPYGGFSYIFSTGPFFDSLKLGGFVVNAVTGQRDTGAQVLLYDAGKSDSIIVREKPLYVVKADGNGNFLFEGLPDRQFKVFALSDPNNNLIYDGPGEKVAFSDRSVHPNDSQQVSLYLFAEADTAAKEAETSGTKITRGGKRGTELSVPDGLAYAVNLDTSDGRKRTAELVKPVQLSFKTKVDSFNSNRISLTYDSVGITVEAPVTVIRDTASPLLLQLQTDWKENTLYTLRLLKGFAKDTAGTDLMPSRYTFRTKRDEDYAKLHIHLPSAYQGDGHLFYLLKDNDSIYLKPVSDTLLHFTRLQPGTYTLRVVVDRNRNGKWDTGDPLGRRQPEEVIPHTNTVMLKPGWENMIDFEPGNKPAQHKPGTATSPGKRGTTR